MNTEQFTMINETISELPPAVRFAIDETAWDYVCPQVGEIHKFSEIQKQNLTVEVGMYLAGLTDMKEFVYELGKITNNEDTIIKKVMHDLITEIFEPFQKALKSNNLDIQEKIEELGSTITQLDTDINEANEEGDLGDIPLKQNSVIQIPIKKKTIDTPTLTVKREEQFSPLLKPSNYTDKKDPYHEDL